MKAYRFILGVAAIAVVSCQEDNIKENSEKWTSPEAALTIEGDTKLTYDPLTWQMSTNEEGEFHVFNEDESDWFLVVCESLPKAVGDVVVSDVKWSSSTVSNVKQIKNIELTVESVDEESGIMKLVNYRQHFCAIVHQLR